MQAHTSSRQSVLDRLQSKVVNGPDLPEIDHSKLTVFDNPIETFREMLSFVGGELHEVDSPDQVASILGEIDAFREASLIASLVPECVDGNFDASKFADPHDLSALDWVVARGEFAVAENGAIWIDGKTLPHRVMLFIAQYQAIVVPKSEMLHHMHQAYERIGTPDPGFGIFVSGPSKTADIEQSLVLGAHGCRKLQVFLV